MGYLNNATIVDAYRLVGRFVGLSHSIVGDFLKQLGPFMFGDLRSRDSEIRKTHSDAKMGTYV